MSVKKVCPVCSQGEPNESLPNYCHTPKGPSPEHSAGSISSLINSALIEFRIKIRAQIEVKLNLLVSVVGESPQENNSGRLA